MPLRDQNRQIVGCFKKQISGIFFAALALLCLLSLWLSQPVYSSDLKGGGSGNSTRAVHQLFNQYKALDLANNPQIMNLYANDAQIDVLGTRYNKTSYGRFIASSYQNPASGLNSHTVYGEPNIRATNDSAQVSFAGALGPSTMYVYWNLRRNSSGVWQIASEQFRRAATSARSAHASSNLNFGNQNLPDGIKQMNDNPDTKAFYEHIKKLREQNH
jgi:hypothetical protein